MSKAFRPKGVRALRFVRVSNYRLGRRLHWKGALAPDLRGAKVSEPIIREVSLKPPADPALRRYSRVIAMVSELHKAGYQRIRLFPALSPNGGFLRAEITFADNTSADGLPINDAWVARYSTGDGTAFFGWRDATDMNARQLAAAFVERFSEIARQGQGRDWAYAGWLLEILGQVEAGDPVILWADGDFLSAEHLTLWRPPAVISETPALPPLHTHIPNEALTLEIVPESNSGWDRLEPFCTYYDGYDGDRRSIAECGDIASKVLDGGLQSASMDELRITLFIRQRRISWNDEPIESDFEDVRRVVDEIRHRLKAQTSKVAEIEAEIEAIRRSLPDYARSILDRHRPAIVRFRAEQDGLTERPEYAPETINFEAADMVWSYFLSRGYTTEGRGFRNDVAQTIKEALRRSQADNVIPLDW